MLRKKPRLPPPPLSSLSLKSSSPAPSPFELHQARRFPPVKAPPCACSSLVLLPSDSEVIDVGGVAEPDPARERLKSWEFEELEEPVKLRAWHVLWERSDSSESLAFCFSEPCSAVVVVAVAEGVGVFHGHFHIGVPKIRAPLG